MPIFTVDGAIGAGKSTILRYLHTHYGVPVDLEPVTKWQPYLDNLYSHGTGAFDLQVRVWMDRAWVQDRKTISTVMERSPFFQLNTFVPLNLVHGRITAQENQMLHELYDRVASLWSPAGCLYLRSSPSACLGRIRKRARPSEDKITMSYVCELNDLHEQAYRAAVANGMRIICVDVDGKSIPDIAEEVYASLESLGYKN